MREILQSALFVVITGLIVKKFSDNASLSSSDATKSYFNIDYKPLHDLRDAVATPTTNQFVVRCLCKGRIMEILNGNGWYYNCCTKCAHAVHVLEAKYYCNACTEDDTQVTQRCGAVVHIEDGSGSTTLTLFNKEAEQLVGVPLQKLLARPQAWQKYQQL